MTDIRQLTQPIPRTTDAHPRCVRMDNLRGDDNDDAMGASEGQRRWAEGWRAADRQRRDRVPSPPLLTTRLTAGSYACPHCGKGHRVQLDRLGLVLRAGCDRGPVRVIWPSEEEES